MSLRRLHCTVRGIVQGVNFRASTRREAARLGLTGWVRNLDDGRVEVLADGDEPRLRELLAWLERGPSVARVDEVRSDWSEGTGGFESFTVRY